MRRADARAARGESRDAHLVAHLRVVERELLREALDRERRADAALARAAHPREPLPVAGEHRQRLGDRLAVALRHEEPVDAVGHHVGNRADRRGDDGDPRRHRFQERVRKSFAVARKQQHVGAAQELHLVGTEDRADEADARRDAERLRVAAQPRLLGAVARDDEPRIDAELVREAHALEQLVESLVARDAADVEQVQRLLGARALHGGTLRAARARAPPPDRAR